MIGELLTRWTIRLALVCFASYFALRLAGTGRQRAERAIWTIGCVLFAAHVAAAFHFYHAWSHAAAWRKTAEETQALLGVPFGDGIYFSYAFLVLWVLDVVWLWISASGSPAGRVAASATCVPAESVGRETTPRWRVLVHAFLLFIAFHGAIVFEGGPTRWLGIPAVCLLAFLGGRQAYLGRYRPEADDHGNREIGHKVPPGAAAAG